MKSTITWYETFVTALKGVGFKLNRYDPSVAYLKVNGKNLKAWYVDDTKISLVNRIVVVT